MILTALKEQVKDPNRVSIYIDKKYACSLTLDQTLEQKLKVGQEIDTEQRKVLEKLSDEGKLYARALEWCMQRPHSIKEFKDYLRRKKVEPELADKCLQKLTHLGYLDDRRFAEWLVGMRIAKHKSHRFISGELRLKGVSSNIINEVLSQAGQDDVDSPDETLVLNDKKAVRALISKLQARQRYADQNKLIRHLLGKGFGYADIKDVLHEEDPGSSV